jgi:hypothetical protein
VFLGIILTVFFSCDVGCEANPTTIWGKGHGVIVAINVLCVNIKRIGCLFVFFK